MVSYYISSISSKMLLESIPNAAHRKVILRRLKKKNPQKLSNTLSNKLHPSATSERSVLVCESKFIYISILLNFEQEHFFIQFEAKQKCCTVLC